MAQKRNALGRGLGALLSMDEVQTEGSSSINEIELSKIAASPNQPRREFNPTALQELAESITEIDIIQPITLRKLSDDEYQITAGERRFRASRIAGLISIPAYIRTASDENVMEMALIENIQRKNLNFVETALAYQRLLEEYGLAQERLSERVGKKRTTIANYLRLLKLPAPIQVDLQDKQVDMGYARTLIMLGDSKLQMKIFEEALEHGYSARKVKEIVKSLNEGEIIKSGGRKIAPRRSKLSEEFNMLKQQLSSFSSAKVQLTCPEKGKGKISIPFNNEEELERIIGILNTLKRQITKRRKIYQISIALLLYFIQTAGIAMYSQGRPRAASKRIRRLQVDSLHALRKAVQIQTDSLTPATGKPMPHQAVMPADNIATADSIAAENKEKLLEMTSSPILQKQEVPADSLHKEINRKMWIPNPTKVAWLALVIPGGGQTYNRKYWKLPVFYGGFAGCVYALTWNSKMYEGYSTAYKGVMNGNMQSSSIIGLLPPGYTISETQLKELLCKRKDTYCRYRDLSIFAFIGVYLLSVIDAYVDAELSNFDITPDLSMKVEPAVINTQTSNSSNRFIRL